MKDMVYLDLTLEQASLLTDLLGNIDFEKEGLEESQLALLDEIYDKLMEEK
jgi:hypothetical protein